MLRVTGTVTTKVEDIREEPFYLIKLFYFLALIFRNTSQELFAILKYNIYADLLPQAFLLKSLIFKYICYSQLIHIFRLKSGLNNLNNCLKYQFSYDFTQTCIFCKHVTDVDRAFSF